MSKVVEKKVTKDNNLESLVVSKTPLIFISHDSRDAELAESFSKLLSGVSGGVLKSFRSSDRKGTQGIEYGIEWYPELMKNLDAASDVVCLLTQRSIDRPWILYEAGVAKGKLDTSVYGIALGIPLNNANNGPFAQFQNCDDNEDSLTKLVMQLVRRIPNSEPDQDAIRMQVKAFKGKVAEILKKIDSNKDKNPVKVAVDDTSVVKLFEEVKLMFQDLPSRIEGRLDPMRRHKMKRLHPMVLEEYLHRFSHSEDPIGFLIIISLLREDLPWLYEIGMETYKIIKTGTSDEIEKACRNFRRAVDFSTHGPLLEEFVDSKEGFMMIRELPMILDKFIHHYLLDRKKVMRKDKE